MVNAPYLNSKVDIVFNGVEDITEAHDFHNQSLILE
jgi:hypothetical protein